MKRVQKQVVNLRFSHQAPCGIYSEDRIQRFGLSRVFPDVIKNQAGGPNLSNLEEVRGHQPANDLRRKIQQRLCDGPLFGRKDLENLSHCLPGQHLKESGPIIGRDFVENSSRFLGVNCQQELLLEISVQVNKRLCGETKE